MPFEVPVKFRQALSFIQRKKAMPTELKSWALEQLPLEVRERAFFSATVTNVQVLDEMLTRVHSIVDGDMSRAQARAEIRRILEIFGYPTTGTGDGGIQDLTSDVRLNLILDTNVSMAREYGAYIRQQDPKLLAAYPVRELYRASARMEPRPWHSKWVLAGGTLYKGRMMARVDDPIWKKPLSEGGFNRFGNPYPPFDFNSGMGMRIVPRATALRLGVIGKTDANPKSKVTGMNEALEARPNILSKQLRDNLESLGLGHTDGDGTFVLKPRGGRN